MYIYFFFSFSLIFSFSLVYYSIDNLMLHLAKKMHYHSEIAVVVVVWLNFFCRYLYVIYIYTHICTRVYVSERFFPLYSIIMETTTDLLVLLSFARYLLRFFLLVLKENIVGKEKCSSLMCLSHKSKRDKRLCLPAKLLSWSLRLRLRTFGKQIRLCISYSSSLINKTKETKRKRRKKRETTHKKIKRTWWLKFS